MSTGQKSDLLPPAVSRVVGDVLRSPGKSLVEPDVQPSQTLAVAPAASDLERLPVTTHDEPAERAARHAEGGAASLAAAGQRPDFSRVRVHTDARAAESAQSLGARAYTVGPHIVFGPGEFVPERDAGRRLLNHELAHTSQPGSERRLARAPVTQYETKPTVIERADIEAMATGSYWEQKVRTRFQDSQVNTVQTRFESDPEERDAVLSVLWQRRPTAPVAADMVVSVSIPARVGAAKSQALLYQFTFTPAPKGGKEGVNIEFKGEGSQAVVSAAAVPPTGYAPPSLSRNAEGFPDGVDKYFKDHPDEHKQLYRWIENVPGPKFDQIVTTSENLPAGKKHESSYRVHGSKDPKTTKLTSLEIDLLSETPTFIENPPPGYATKDRTNLELEKQQAKAADKLGQVNGLTTLPPDEQISVRFVVFQYFDGGTRNKEVDVILPIANKTKRVFYTLRFRPGSNDVDIERVGEEASSVKLTATALNIGRVEGFAANSADPAAFKAWISKRYPAVTPQGTTLPELQDSVSKEMEASAATPEWFKKNYDIEILDAAPAATRLQTVHRLSSAETAALKSYSAEELKRLEFALETMSDAELQIVKGTKMARQDVKLELKGRPPVATPDPKTTGVTWQVGSEKTIIIFDTASGNEQQLFAGGAAGVRPSSVQTFAHEFGHVMETQANLVQPFKAFVRAKGIKPITWYAAAKPVTESFTEAFALFQTDPEWMQANLPALFVWFEEVKKTGRAPANP